MAGPLPAIFLGVLGALAACSQDRVDLSRDASEDLPKSQDVPLPQAVKPPGAESSADAWTAWGGPSGDFVVATAGPLAESWPKEGPPVVWERPLGRGYSSILSRGGVLYTMYRDQDEEVVIALNAATGETRWEHRETPALWPDMTDAFGLGPNSTPLVLGELIFAVDISGHLRALDLERGALVWQFDLPAELGRLQRVEEYGYSGNPLAYGDAVIVLAGGERAAVVALETDGSIRWASEPGGVSYAQPKILRLAGRDQYVYFEPEGVVALDPLDGRTLFKHTIEFTNGNHLTPAVRLDENHLFIGSQFSTGGGRLLALARDGETIRVEEVWFKSELETMHSTHIARGEYVYGSIGSNYTSSLAAMRWRTGELLWSEDRFHKAQALWADDKLLFLDEAGQLVLARVSPERFEVLARAEVLGAKAWTLPTLVGTTLFLRDQKKILALDLAVQPDRGT